jgi:nucleoid DNA-binding protein
MSTIVQGKSITKTELAIALADTTGLSKKDVGNVLDALEGVIRKELGKKGPGVFALPGLLKIEKKKRPARPARQGRNPATGETITLKAQPAKTVVKVRALKNLKEMIA